MNILHSWVGLFHKRITENESLARPTWSVPAKDDIPGLLSVICRGSPKLRIAPRLTSEIVILANRKLTIWCSLPATQLLIYACLQALRIGAACFTSELTTAERSDLLRKFCTSADRRVFIGSYYVGSTGLNLQQICNHTAEFDAPPTTGASYSGAWTTSENCLAATNREI